MLPGVVLCSYPKMEVIILDPDSDIRDVDHMYHWPIDSGHESSMHRVADYVVLPTFYSSRQLLLRECSLRLRLHGKPPMLHFTRKGRVERIARSREQFLTEHCWLS